MRAFSIPKAIIAAIVCAALATAAAAQKPFADVGKQDPITMLVPSAPWLPSFTKMVELYEQQTGNKIKLDVNPSARRPRQGAQRSARRRRHVRRRVSRHAVDHRDV